MHVVSYQLSLFPWRPVADFQSMGHPFRGNRTPDQFIRSVLSYLQWRSGETWIRGCEQRFAQDRVDYLDAFRVVNDARYREPLALALPPLHPTPTIPKQERELAVRSRAWLVNELVCADGRLTNRRLLSHLSRPKLAHMLAEARAQVKRTA